MVHRLINKLTYSHMLALSSRAYMSVLVWTLTNKR